jgi:ABC-type cobalamin/Fe3+-siderophores transport system ATPase subunit
MYDSEARIDVRYLLKWHQAGGLCSIKLSNPNSYFSYSLLGSSGCGKTTLLNCVVGMKHLNSGKILVFGAKTGTKASGVPGKRVGFMPQVQRAISNKPLNYYRTS